MDCPNCDGTSACGTCGGDQVVPDWLADPAVNPAWHTWVDDPGGEVR